MRISITHNDCLNGHFSSNRNCPIAKAFKRRGFSKVSVCPLSVDTKEGSFLYVHSQADRKAYSFGRGDNGFIKPLIGRANRGEKFTKYIQFKLR